MPLDPARTVAELRELRELTADENGAQRVAWTDTWESARGWLRGKLDGTGAEEEVDAAGNQWFTLRGESDRALLIGGHIDSVPNGGWLDGSLTSVAAEVRFICSRVSQVARLQTNSRVASAFRWLSLRPDEENITTFGRSPTALK